MKNLIPSDIQKNKNVLYIIGNGFDLANGMKTSYEDFHQWLLCNGESNAVYRLERLYPNLRNDLGRWCDIETALGIEDNHASDYIAESYVGIQLMSDFEMECLRKEGEELKRTYQK